MLENLKYHNQTGSVLGMSHFEQAPAERFVYFELSGLVSLT